MRSIVAAGAGAAAVVVAVLLGNASVLADQACRWEQFDGTRYAVCSFDPGKSDLRLFWRNSAGDPYRTFASLAEAVEGDGRVLLFAMNAGMFHPDFTPVGLHVEHGQELRPATTADAPPGTRPLPNFFRKPNGVFHISDRGAGVTTTEHFLDDGRTVTYATQSGPMLVIDSALHPDFIMGSTDRTRRSGVGVSRAGMVRFAISQDPVNFLDFARFFRDHLGCPNALFLDGGRGTGLYAPELGRDDVSGHGGFGPIVGVVARR
jgi:uncharacterized protein YigE (DUF2233 family)